jgi:hypothetical protein
MTPPQLTILGLSQPITDQSESFLASVESGGELCGLGSRKVKGRGNEQQKRCPQLPVPSLALSVLRLPLHLDSESPLFL